jgi:hypothetical protein
MTEPNGATVLLSGGIGKCEVFSAFIPKLAEKYGNINIMSPWQDLFDGLPGVRRSVSMGVEYGYEDYFKNKNRFSPEPYNRNDFFNKKISLLEAFALELGLEYNEETDMPLVPASVDFNSKKKIDDIAKAGKYIVVQFMGGNQAQNGKLNDKFMTKDYPPQMIEELIMGIIKTYGDKYQIVNYGLPFEFNIASTIPGGDIGYTAAPYLLSKAETFIAIDSNLQHFSACKGVRKKGIVLWGATDPVAFGYKFNVNMTNKCPYNDQHCSRPYFQHTSDVIGKGIPWSCKTRDCINVQPELVLAELKEILKK